MPVKSIDCKLSITLLYREFSFLTLIHFPSFLLLVSIREKNFCKRNYDTVLVTIFVDHFSKLYYTSHIHQIEKILKLCAFYFDASK